MIALRTAAWHTTSSFPSSSYTTSYGAHIPRIGVKNRVLHFTQWAAPRNSTSRSDVGVPRVARYKNNEANGRNKSNEKRFAPSTNYKAKSAKEMCPRALLTLSLLAMILFVSGKTGSVKAPNYIMDLYRCVRDKTPLDCYGVEADSVQSIGGKGTENSALHAPLAGHSSAYDITLLFISFLQSHRLIPSAVCLTPVC